MNGTNGFHLVEYLNFVVKRKELLLLVFLSSLVLSYGAIYFLIEEQFEATATVIPRQDDASSVSNGLLRGLKGMSLGSLSKSSSSETDIYKTIIYSRSMMEYLIHKFDLVRYYRMDTTKVDYMEMAIKRLKKEISTEETEESALVITIRATSRQRAADMVNEILAKMNERIVELNVSRSAENRAFLGKRVEEIQDTLRQIEDSMRAFQERTGLLDVKSQVQGIVTAHATLEADLAAKNIQKGILEKLYDENSAQVKEMDLQVQELQKRMMQLRLEGDRGGVLVSLSKLPKISAEFLRLYREIEINTTLLEYVIPLYEQAKIEEKKDYPVIQVIDYAVPPAKKSYPPRTLLSLLGSVSITLLVLVFLRLREKVKDCSDQRWLALFAAVKYWNWKKD
jgi:tyrosine-protein kinase Etk/Wzc